MLNLLVVMVEQLMEILWFSVHSVLL